MPGRNRVGWQRPLFLAAPDTMDGPVFQGGLSGPFLPIAFLRKSVGLDARNLGRDGKDADKADLGQT